MRFKFRKHIFIIFEYDNIDNITKQCFEIHRIISETISKAAKKANDEV